jgi:hypothetical protein
MGLYHIIWAKMVKSYEVSMKIVKKVEPRKKMAGILQPAGLAE